MSEFSTIGKPVAFVDATEKTTARGHPGRSEGSLE
jgi:hypothetical protein